MPIKALPTPPSRSRPANFSDETDTFLGSLPQFVTEVNSLTTEYEENATIISTNVPLVLSAANFIGEWSTLTGTVTVPASVFYLGAYWALAEDIPDVETEVPGVSLKWLPIPIANHAINYQLGVI